MANQYFDQILNRGIATGQIPNKTRDARSWYRDAAQKIMGVKETALFKGKGTELTTSVDVGSMYMFSYDPKTKETLPYYDMFPLVFPIGPAKGGFLGLNMHYLPPLYRAALMDSLYGTANNVKFDQTTKLRISYETLSRARGVPYFKPCIKHYLLNHVRSKFIYVAPKEWDIALFLPTAQWQKADQNDVWADSKRIIRG